MTLHRYITVTKDVYSNRYPWVVKFFSSCKSQSFIIKYVDIISLLWTLSAYSATATSQAGR